MSSSLIIWGAGGHGRVVLDVARSTGRYDQIVFVDDDPAKSCLAFCGCEVIGGIENVPQGASDIVMGVGVNQIRAQCFSRAMSRGFAITTLVHASAVVSDSAIIGAGTVIMPGVIVNAGAVIGDNCIINTAAVIEHDCKIGAHVHISPGAVLGGGVTVGTLAHVGLGAIVLPLVSVGEESIVGAGSVVLKHAPPRCTLVGAPARVLSK